MCISDYTQTTFFYLGRFLKKWADDHCSSILKAVSTISSIMSMQLFTIGVDWPEIRRLMEVSHYVWYLHILCIYFVGQTYWYLLWIKMTNFTHTHKILQVAYSLLCTLYIILEFTDTCITLFSLWKHNI